jgi:alpha-L-arabinofuranosidase
MESALYAGRLMNVFERQQNGGDDCSIRMVNGWSGGVIQASRHDVFVTPTYLVNQLYAEHLGSERVDTKVESPTFDSTSEGKSVSFLDVIASRSANGRQLFIRAVNTDVHRAMATSIEIRSVSVGPVGTLETVAGGGENSFRTPEAVSIHKAQFRSGNSFDINFPKASVSVVVVDLK